MGQRTDISSLDHAYVVPTITDTAHALFSIAPDESSDICFLRRRASTRNYGRKFGCDLYELVLKQAEAELRKHEPIKSAIIAVGTRMPTWSDSPSITRQQSSLFCKKSSSFWTSSAVFTASQHGIR